MLQSLASLTLASILSVALSQGSPDTPPAALPAPTAATDEAAPLPRRAGPMGLNLRFDADGGVRIAATAPGLPAAEAGVPNQSRIVSVNGTPIRSREDLATAMRKVKAGTPVKLETQLPDQPPRVMKWCSMRSRNWCQAAP